MSLVDPRQLVLPLDKPDSNPTPAPAPQVLAAPKALRLPQPDKHPSSISPPNAAKPVIPEPKRRLQMDGHTVEYLLRRSKRHSIGFLINDDGLRVTAPRWTTISTIENAIRNKQNWILTKLDKRRERLAAPRPMPMQWQDGAVLPYLGKSITLRLATCAAEKIFLHDISGELTLPVSKDATGAQVQDRVKKWLQQEAKRLFAERIPLYAVKLGVTCHSVGISSATRRWGSCSPHGKIRLNWRLIHFSLPLIDYVIAHELSHLREMNHGPRFWTTVASVFPEYESAKKSLRELAPAIFPLF